MNGKIEEHVEIAGEQAQEMIEGASQELQEMNEKIEEHVDIAEQQAQ